MSNVRLTLEKGARLEIRVKHPKQLVPSPARPIANAFFVTGVWTANGLHHPSRLTAQDKDGSTFVVIVPYQQAMRVDFTGSNHAITDTQGSALASTASQFQLNLTNEAVVQVAVAVDVAHTP